MALRGLFFFTTDEYGIFNGRAHFGAFRAHEGGSGTNRSAQELTRRDRTTGAHLSPLGDGTHGFRILILTL